MINIGLIGFGYWGPNVAKNLFNNPNFNLKIICDHNDKRLESAQKIYIEQITYLSSYKQLLVNNSIEAIAITVETREHYQIAKDSLLAGKHIYVEKPFTSTLEEAEELSNLAIDLGLIIHVNHIMVFHPIIQRIKIMIDSGELGKILYIDSKRLNLGHIKKDVSAMWDLAVHDLSIIDYLFDGKIPFYISAIGEKIYNPKETLVFLSLRYQGFVAHIQASWISPLKERKLVVAGSKKMVVFDDMKTDEKFMIYEKGIHVISGDHIEDKNYAVKIREGDVLLPHIVEEDALYNSLNHFSESILEKKVSISDSKQAIRLLNILCQADTNMNK